MDNFKVGYLDTEGNEDFIEVEAEDEANAEEAARGELSAEHSNVASDEWEIVSCERIAGIAP